MGSNSTLKIFEWSERGEENLIVQGHQDSSLPEMPRLTINMRCKNLDGGGDAVVGPDVCRMCAGCSFPRVPWPASHIHGQHRQASAAAITQRVESLKVSIRPSGFPILHSILLSRATMQQCCKGKGSLKAQILDLTTGKIKGNPQTPGSLGACCGSEGPGNQKVPEAPEGKVMTPYHRRAPEIEAKS